MYLRLFLKWWSIVTTAVFAYNLFIAFVINFALWQVPSVDQFVDYALGTFRLSLLIGLTVGGVVTLAKRFA